MANNINPVKQQIDEIRTIVDGFEGEGAYDVKIAKMIEEMKKKKYNLLTDYGKKLLSTSEKMSILLRIFNPFIWLWNMFKYFAHLEGCRIRNYPPYDFDNDTKYFYALEKNKRSKRNEP